jgi:hypothetical protein
MDGGYRPLSGPSYKSSGVKSIGRVLVAVALACALAAAAPDQSTAAGQWRAIAFKGDGRIESDGVRFAWIRKWLPDFQEGPVRVFDTRRGRSFWLRAPRPDCRFADIGGGFALWRCDPPRKSLLVNLATGLVRRPVGIGRFEALGNEWWFCGAQREVGRHWVAVGCTNGFGPGIDPQYLNHRTGELTRPFINICCPPAPRLDVNSRDLTRPLCRPLRWDALMAYAPPLALQTPDGLGLEVERLRLRRCGQERGEVLSSCFATLCQTPQLGSGYVTWGEHRRVFAYLPRLRRRVLVGRAPSETHGQISVAHTCDRVFAQWSRRIYVTRFEPRRGAPPCQ